MRIWLIFDLIEGSVVLAFGCVWWILMDLYSANLFEQLLMLDFNLSLCESDGKRI